ncbi:oxaloacetate decarboxylase [Carnobacterium sp. AT7]|uniref:OadG family protein n=1 Tax=Carnobacterium TaxID=2747 RepID=UPI00015EF6EB|nr:MULTISPECIES: OadG family protein [Carnobacterium]EDP67837.1 oxaloacetate decarboxylase [Carnobacterium sp. AT7]
MEKFSYLDIVVITVIGLLVFFLVLIGWQLIHQMMKFRPKKYQEIESFSPEKQNDLAVDEDEETRMVAVLMALILANDEQQDKTYCVTKIERIR